ncbi:hypothetical protein [Collinsella aerofaciens]|uniref:hypothetical protein n=1 Tax=Collinsella aerofaciens TaxID=74426 RepID=UPI0034A181AD
MAKDRYLQALRGLAISAVVLIHCLPQCAASVAIRPFLNFSVALFFFYPVFLPTSANLMRGGVFDAALARLPDLMRSGALSILRRFPPFMGVWVSGVRRGLRIGSDVLSIGLFTACAAYSGTVQAPFTV